MSQATIVIAEDTEDARVLLAAVLTASGYEVVTCENGKLALDAIHQHRPDMIISDIMMPEMDGYSLCRAVKSDPALRNIPFLFYTATFIEAQDKILADQLGADRFLIKPLDPDILLQHITEVFAAYARGEEVAAPVQQDALAIAQLHIDRLTSKLAKKSAELDTVAKTDPVTGAHNREHFKSRLQERIRAATGGEFALIVMDVDRFHIVNEALGYVAGDSILKAVGHRIFEYFGDLTHWCRLGGDEFALLMEANSHIAALTAAQDLLSIFKEPFYNKGQRIFLSGSVGIARFPNDGGSTEELLRNAETAMFHAKHQGGGVIEVYHQDLTSLMSQQLSLESNMREALKHDEFVLHFQPQVDIRSQRIVGVEALLRWQHPSLGLLTPDRFITLSEVNRCIVDIGDWVLNAAATVMKVLHQRSPQLKRLAVNVSPVQLMDDAAFLQRLENALLRSGLPPEYIELELTEGFYTQSGAQFQESLSAIKNLGVRLAIDDFGTGHSSLSRLKSMPIDTLKIDKSFIKEVAQNPDDQAITRSIIALGHNLSKIVVAEGVETLEQLAFLQSENCEIAQGFYFGRPMTPDNLLKLLN